MTEAHEVDLIAARVALDDVFAEVSRWRATQDSVRKLIKQFMDERDQAVNLVADMVAKATEYGTQDGDFVASYILPTGPIHRAIPWLQEHGRTVRPGSDDRADLGGAASVATTDTTEGAS